MKANSLTILKFLFTGLICSGCGQKVAMFPNILFVLSDDHAYQVISAYGDTLIETPYIASFSGIYTRHHKRNILMLLPVTGVRKMMIKTISIIN